MMIHGGIENVAEQVVTLCLGEHFGETIWEVHFSVFCEVIVGPYPKCLPSSIPILPILLRAILYFLQYMQSFPPIVHLFYLIRFPILYIFVSNIQPGSPIYLWYPNPTSIYD